MTSYDLHPDFVVWQRQNKHFFSSDTADEMEAWRVKYMEYWQLETDDARRRFRYDLSAQIGATEDTIKGRLTMSRRLIEIQVPTATAATSTSSVVGADEDDCKPVHTSFNRKMKQIRAKDFVKPATGGGFIASASRLTSILDVGNTSGRNLQKTRAQSIASVSSKGAGNPTNTSDIKLEVNYDYATSKPSQRSQAGEVIDLCSSDSESEGPSAGSTSQMPAIVKEEIVTFRHGKAGKATKNVAQFLAELGIPQLVPILHKHRYTSAADLRHLRTMPKETREIVLGIILKDPKVLLRDWSILHAALTTASEGL